MTVLLSSLVLLLIETSAYLRAFRLIWIELGAVLAVAGSDDSRLEAVFRVGRVVSE